MCGCVYLVFQLAKLSTLSPQHSASCANTCLVTVYEWFNALCVFAWVVVFLKKDISSRQNLFWCQTGKFNGGQWRCIYFLGCASVAVLSSPIPLVLWSVCFPVPHLCLKGSNPKLLEVLCISSGWLNISLLCNSLLKPSVWVSRLAML